jgi:hypothetical protein
VASRPDLKRVRLAALSTLVKSKKPGHLEKYFQLLTDFNFIAEKVNHPDFGLQALIKDYDLVNNSGISNQLEYNPEKVKSLKLIQGALRLSAHVLAEDKTQLAGQLLGRLMSYKALEIQAMLKQAKQWNTSPWLRPLTASLKPPIGELERTLALGSYFLCECRSHDPR